MHEKTLKKNSREQRLSAIRDLLQSQDEVSISALARQFGVSEMTIRRDLDNLELTGQVRRTHGGAMPAERMVFEFNFAVRRQANRPAKQAIAREALKLVNPGQRIILDTGTTTLELAHLLRDFDDLTVLTPSLAVASELQFSEGIETILLGGEIRKGSPDLTGLVAETVLDMFSADIAFQGADGIDNEGGVYTADMRISKVDQKIRQRASRTYCLADSSKVGHPELVRHGFIHEMDGFITDAGLDPKLKVQLEKKGAKITVVRILDSGFSRKNNK